MAYYTQPNLPNISDYQVFLQNELQIPATALPYALGAPVAPTLSPSASGGSLPSGNVYVRVSYVSQFGVAMQSGEAVAAVVGPSGSVAVTAPPAITNAMGWNVYAASATGGEVLQNATPIPIATGTYTITTLAVGTATPPTVDASLSPWIGFAFNRGLALTLVVPGTDASDYVHVVYCCAAHIQLEITPDLAGQTYFATAAGQQGFALSSSIAGVVAGASDQGTSSSVTVPDAMRNLTFQDLQFSKTPWGRTWLGWGQDFGAPWGLT